MSKAIYVTAERLAETAAKNCSGESCERSICVAEAERAVVDALSDKSRYVEALERVAEAAREWFEVQRGCMSTMGPAGIAVGNALADLAKVKGAHDAGKGE